MKKLFRNENDPAPVRAAHFVHGEVDTGESDDIHTSRQQIQQDTVTLGRNLLAAV